MSRLGWAEEVFYRRLHSVVDDFGRYYADHGLLRAACYPRQLNKVSDPDIGKWLTVLVEAALVRVYPAEDGERYLEVLDFGQQVRAKKSKFPQPPGPADSLRSTCLADAKHEQSKSATDALVFGDVSVSVSEDGGDTPARKRATSPLCPDGVDAQVWSDFLALRKAKKAPVTQTVMEGAQQEAVKAGLTLEAFLRVWVRRGSQGLEADWLKPHERGQQGPPAETPYARQMRERAAVLAPGVAAKAPGQTTRIEVIDTDGSQKLIA